MVQDVVNLADKANTVMTSNGDIPYYNSGSRQRLAIGVEGKVLTVSSSDLPAWETAAGISSPLTSNLVVNDNINLLFGTGSDASIDYNGTDMIIDPQVVGSGGLKINAGGITGIPVGIGQFAKCEHLGTYRATSEENSKDFTGLTLDMDDTYAKLKLIISGAITASGTLNGIIDSRTSGGAYNFNYTMNDSGTISGVISTNQNTMLLLPAALMDGAVIFYAELDIVFSGYYSNVMNYQWRALSTEEGTSRGGGHMTMSSGGDTIDAVGFSASENWEIGTQADLYGWKL